MFKWTSIAAAIGHGITQMAAYIENDMIAKQPVAGDLVTLTSDTTADVKKTISDGMSTALAAVKTGATQQASDDLAKVLSPVLGSAVAGYAAPALVTGLMNEGESLLAKL